MWAANPSLPGEAAFHFGLFSFFYVVPRFVQTHGKRGGLEIFHLSNPGVGWTGQVRRPEGNGLYQRDALIPSCKTEFQLMLVLQTSSG